MGFITLAIPLAPGGFGVGHVAFENILQAFQVSGGANHFNLYFVWWTLFSLTGVIPYLLSGTKINKNEMLSLVPLEDDNELRITSIIAKGRGKKKYIPLLLIS